MNNRTFTRSLRTVSANIIPGVLRHLSPVLLSLCLLCSFLTLPGDRAWSVELTDRLILANKMQTFPDGHGINPANPYWWTIPTLPWNQQITSRPSAWCTNLSASPKLYPTAGSSDYLLMLKQGHIDEINQAKAYGIDGFIVCVTATGTAVPAALNDWNATVAAAEAVGEFYICLQPDLTTGVTPQSLKPFVDAAISSPAYLKIGNLPLIVPYCAGYGQASSEKTAWFDWYAAQGTPISYIPSIFINLNKYADNDLGWKNPTDGYATFASAITAFSPTCGDSARDRALDYWQGIGTLPYVTDLAFQFQNTAGAGFLQNHGSRSFRQTFEWAIKNRNNGVSWVQPLCWNDFKESAFVPNSNLFMALAPISKYYSDWFKSGIQPQVTKESVTLFHRHYPSAAVPSLYPLFADTNSEPEVEAVTLLNAPATLYIDTGGTIYTENVGAGIQAVTRTFGIGIQKAWVVRNSVTVASVTTPVPIQSNPIQSNVWTAGYTSAYPPENVPLTNWTTNSGTLAASGTTASGTGVALVGDCLALFDYCISATVTPSSGADGTKAGVLVYAQGEKGQSPSLGASYFSFTIGKWNNAAGWRLSSIDSKDTNNPEKVLLGGVTTYAASQARVLRLDKVGDYLMCYLDGVQVGCIADWGPRYLPEDLTLTPPRYADTITRPSDDFRWAYGQGGVLAAGASSSFSNIKMERYQPNMTNIAAKPVFSVAPGRYASAQSVSITCATTGATIRYTTNGTEPSATVGTVYTGPVSISASSILKAIAYKTGMFDSYVRSGEYFISAASQAAAPAFNLVPGSHAGSRMVTISSTTPGSLIRYTLDGSTPTALYGYAGPAAVIHSSCTLKAVAYRNYLTTSTVTSGSYTITPTTGWVQIGTADPATYSTPDSTALQPAFSALGNIPAELAVSGGTVPDLKVTYRLVVNPTSGFSYQSSGRHGLVLFSGDTPNIDSGLFSGDDTWYMGGTPAAPRTFGALVGTTGQPHQPIGVPWLWICNFDQASGNRPNTFDMTLEIVNGVATTTMQTIKPAGYPGSTKAYSVTTADAGNWTGAMKFAAFRGGGYGSLTNGNYNYSRTYVTNVCFYKRPWVQIGTTDTNTYATPDSVLSAPAFSPLGNVPAELAITGGAIPDLKVTYRLVVNGVSGYGFQTSGRHGLMLYAATTPVVTDGLFGGVDSYSYKTYGAMTGNTGQPPAPTGPFIWDNAVIRGNPNTFDVTIEVNNGLAKTTVVTILPTGMPDSIQTYTTTAADVTNWNGQLKFAAFRGGLGTNYAYSRAFVSNISFYKKAP